MRTVTGAPRGVPRASLRMASRIASAVSASTAATVAGGATLGPWLAMTVCPPRAVSAGQASAGGRSTAQPARTVRRRRAGRSMGGSDRARRDARGTPSLSCRRRTA